ncbi:MAG: hypothetical protein ACI4AD_09720, partial [Roseburia sp.]
MELITVLAGMSHGVALISHHEIGIICNLPENAFIRETDEGKSRFMGWSMDSGKRTGDYADKEEV